MNATAPLQVTDKRHPVVFHIGCASEADRQVIYRLRHEVYARELAQHLTNQDGQLTDALDPHNIYLVAHVNDEVAGFISITPPAAPHFSIDKYLTREELPFAIDAGTFEVRLLTVLKGFRGTELAMLLMYAAFRWVEAHGGTNIAAIGRRQVLDLYLKSGLRQVGRSIRSGQVHYELLHAAISDIRSALERFHGALERAQPRVVWDFNFRFDKPADCFHGGAFFKAIGEKFDRLGRRHEIINADVLDAWFPPAPKVLEALQSNLDWLLRTSPPTACEGFVETVAETRGVRPLNILPAAGSSDAIFRAFTRWLTPRSHALILDPTYGEYAHMLEDVIGCTVDRLSLSRGNDYDVDLDRLQTALRDNYDLVVLVNPNSPTGRHIPAGELRSLLQQAPAATRIWIDETYVDYAGGDQSLEQFAATTENVVVCKSMSKVYALSGMRAAYLCASPHQLEDLRAITPPWVIGLPAQVAAVAALNSPEYYEQRYAETHRFREELKSALEDLSLDVVPGMTNCLLTHLPEESPNAAQVVKACRERGLFIRDAKLMGTNIGERVIRLAVKDAETNRRIIQTLASALGGTTAIERPF